MTHENLDDGASDCIKAAQKSVVAAEEMYKAANADPGTSQNLLALTAKVLEEAQTTLAIAMSRQQDASSDGKTCVPAMKTEDEEDEEEEEEEEDEEDEKEEEEPLLKAATKAGEVLELVKKVRVLGYSSRDLEVICERILVVDESSPAHGAVRALEATTRAISSRPVEAALEHLKEMERMVRDIVVLRCKSVCKNRKDRDEFLEVAHIAYEGKLDTTSYKEIRAQLLLAYHKDPKNQDGFVSNNQVAAQRRGYPRPRRRRNLAKEKQPGGAGAASSDQVFAPGAPDSADAIPGRSRAPPPIVKPKPVVKKKRSASPKKRSAAPHQCTQRHLVSLAPSGFSGAIWPNVPQSTCPSSSSSRLPYQDTSSCPPYANSPSCFPYPSPWDRSLGHDPALFERNTHGNKYGNDYGMGFPSPLLEEVPVPWEYSMPTDLQSNNPWQVLILVELNHLLIHCDLEALRDGSWGESTEFEQDGFGYRIFTRPGAIDFLRFALQQSPRSCTLGIFSGLKTSNLLQMVKELLRQTAEGDEDEWQAEEGPHESVSFVNKDMTQRVHIFHRTEHEELGSDMEAYHNKSGEQLAVDFIKAIFLANFQATYWKYTLQNTVLLAFKEERNWLSDNVLSVERWMYPEDGEYMKSIRDRITSLFQAQPEHVKTWLKSGIQYHII